MDDKWLLAFLSEYSGRNLKLYRYQREKFKRKCQDRNPVLKMCNRVIFTIYDYFRIFLED